MSRIILCWLLLCGLSHAADVSRPNIVFIMLDNVGQEWFGSYGSEEGCTPNMDKLATTGMRVQHCYTPPVCGPSRVQLLTGRYPHSTGFRLHHDAALYGGGGLDPKREILFPRLFRDAGYATALSGKWQVNNLYDEPQVLTQHGFDQQLAWPGSLEPTKVKGADLERFWQAVAREDADETTAFIQHIESRYWDPIFIRNGKREEHPGRFGPDVAQEFAFEFMEKNKDRPFLLYYPMMLTHGHTFTVPVVPTPDHPEPDLPHREMFGNMLRYADKLVGDFVAELERQGLRDNTILFVASDNGTEKSFTARRNGRQVTGGLYTMTEAGGDVVLMANSPKLIPAGRTLPLADFTDLYPTFCELASVPLSPDHAPDGKSFAQFLLGKTDKAPREWILNEYHETRVVRDTQHKLYSDGRFYDANADPVETTNLSMSEEAGHVAARKKLQKVLKSLPPDVEPPFHLRSQSGFRLRTELKKNAADAGDGPVWKRYAIDSSSRGADGVKLGDVNGDGLPDMISGWEEGGVVRLYLHPGHEATKKPWPQVTVGKVTSAEDAILADLDNDGQLEAISLTEGKTRSVFWHRFTGQKDELLDAKKWTTDAFPATAGKQMWMQAYAANLDGQHGQDLLLSSKGTNATIGWLQAPENPADLAAWKFNVLRKSGWIMSLMPHDMDADGDDDIVFTDRKGAHNGLFWLENPGAEAVRKETDWTEHAIGAQGREVMFADIADMNGDGLQDVIVAVKPVEVLIYLRQKDDTWQQQSIFLQKENLGDAKAVKAADVNGDGLMDIFFTCENAKGSLEGIVWLEQQTGASWKQHSLGGPEGVKFDLMQLLDLDDDGDLDVITCEERDQLGVVWYENPYSTAKP